MNGFLQIKAGFESLFQRMELSKASDFLSWTGVVVGGHVRRLVEQVERQDGDRSERFFLKKERRVRWRDRFVNGWQGFGWCSDSVREAQILEQARTAGIDCPQAVAYGELEGSAFLLLQAEEGLIEMRHYLDAHPATSSFAEALGQALARMHQAGFDHPDLYAKHILVDARATPPRFCILDWARSQPGCAMTWSRRWRDLAALDATLAEHLASDQVRLRCLKAYLKCVGFIPLRRAAWAIRQRSERLLRRRRIRDQRHGLWSLQQHFIRMDGDRLCLTPGFHASLGGQIPDWLVATPGPEIGSWVAHEWIELPEGKVGRLIQRREAVTAWPHRDSASPEWNLAGTLFRLERFGIQAPRLLALGQHLCSRRQRFSFILYEPLSLTSWPKVLPLGRERGRIFHQAGWLLRQLHEAGYNIPAGLRLEQVLARTPDDRVTVHAVESLCRVDPVQARRRFFRLLNQQTAWSRTDRLRLSLGYYAPEMARFQESEVAS